MATHSFLAHATLMFLANLARVIAYYVDINLNLMQSANGVNEVIH